MTFADINDDELAASSPAATSTSHSNQVPTPNSNNRTPMDSADKNKYTLEDDEADDRQHKGYDRSSDEYTSEDDEEHEHESLTRPTKLRTADIDQEVQQYLHSRGRALSPQQTPGQALRAAADELLLKVEVSGSPRRSASSDTGRVGSSDANVGTAETGKDREDNNIPRASNNNEAGTESTTCARKCTTETIKAANDQASCNRNDAVNKESVTDKKQSQPTHVPSRSSSKRPKRKIIFVVLIALALAIVVAVVVGLVASRGRQQKAESDDASMISPESDTSPVFHQSVSTSPRPSLRVPAIPEATSVPTFTPTVSAEQEFAASPKCTHIPYASHKNFRFAFRRWGTDRPVRFLQIYTPRVFDPSQPNKVIFLYHGRTEGFNNFLGDDMQGLADEHGYVLVAVDGLLENDVRSFTFPGSADGIGTDGVTATTCNTSQTMPSDYNQCAPSCQIQGRCNNRCGFSSCLDDDIKLFIDLVNEVALKYVCLDRSRVYVYGFDQGGMLAWSLAQDPRSAPLIAGIAAAQGLPLHDYLVGKGAALKTIPAIGIYSNNDCTVPPGNGTAVFNEGCDGEGYRFVDAFRLHTLWEEEHGCCVDKLYPAKHSYKINGRDEVSCSSHCNPSDGPPMSVDCRNDDSHLEQSWHLDVAMKFFDDHLR